MAELDVSEVITDPLFTSPVTLIHRVESFDGNGNPVWDDSANATVQAVVTSDLKSLERLPDALRREGTILVRFMKEDAPDGFQGGGYDAVLWRGKRFVVKDTADYSQFGRGFLRMTCWPEEVSDGSY
ncbi:MAG TPA: hypothetical protein IAC66_07535 [Candidatus Aphodousia gallistercoris]|nr:hypothetical protein [Candidatus Aphodousia gallistercoris]